MSKKVKSFIKKHWKEIIIATGATVVGGVIGYKYSKPSLPKVDYSDVHDAIWNLLNAADNDLKGKHIIGYTQAMTDGYHITVDELGKLGEYMKKCPGCVIDGKITHFLCLGYKE